MKRIGLILIGIFICGMASGADFTVTETQTTEYTIKLFQKLYTLNAGGKLTDYADLVEVANKTIPAGYKVEVGVTIRAKVKKLP